MMGAQDNADAGGAALPTGGRPMDRRARLALRAATLDAMRAFFRRRDYTEVETPVRLPTPALELHIDAIPADGAYLRTSPEFHMKRLLAEGFERIVELGPCFRRGERGARHLPEYTMLEWYRVGSGYRELMQECRDLLLEVAQRVLGGTRMAYRGRMLDLALPWEWITVAEAFQRHAGWNPVAAFDADRFDADMVGCVEPALPRDRAVILADYPPQAAALARLRPGAVPVAERWELYLGGMELANAYTELTDAVEQRARLLACREERAALGREVYELDGPFLEALEQGIPDCAGIALGVDRLLMVMTDSAHIAEVRCFSP